MSESTSSRSLLWVPILVFILLYLLMLTFTWRPIEQDVNTSVQNVLDQEGYDWVNVELHNRGRDVLITGAAPTELDLRQAEELVSNIDKVRVVDSDFTLGEPIVLETASTPTLAPSVEVFSDGSRVYLRGELPSQAAIDTLISQAQERYGVDSVTQELILNEERLPFDYAEALFNVVDKAQGPRTITLADGIMTVEGAVHDEETQVAVLSTLSQTLGVTVQINNQLAIAPPAPAKEAFLAAEQPVDQVIEQAEQTVIAAIPDEQVDALQCGKIFSAFLSDSNIQFASGKAVVKNSSHELLNNLAQVAAKCPEASFEVAGHTDSAGNERFNKRLSQARAQSVIALLTKQGVDVARMSAVGYGSKNPIATNTTREGRAENRRIELIISQK